MCENSSNVSHHGGIPWFRGTCGDGHRNGERPPVVSAWFADVLMWAGSSAKAANKDIAHTFRIFRSVQTHFMQVYAPP